MVQDLRTQNTHDLLSDWNSGRLNPYRHPRAPMTLIYGAVWDQGNLSAHISCGHIHMYTHTQRITKVIYLPYASENIIRP